MYIITKPKVNRVISNFVNKEVRNREGISIQTVAEDNKKFMEQFLNRFYCAFESLFEDKLFASEIFSKRLFSYISFGLT